MIVYYVLLVLTVVYIYPHLPSLFGLTLTKSVGILAVVVGLFRYISLRQPLRMFHWAESKVFLLLCCWIFASQAVVYFETGLLVSTFWSYVSHLGFLLATLTFLDSFKRVETACYVIVFSISLLALSAFKDYFRWNLARPGGFAGDPNYATLIALCVLPMCFLLLVDNTFRNKLFLGTSGILIVACCLLSSSRGGAIGLAASLVYTWMRVPRKIVGVLGIGVILIGTAIVVPTKLATRMSTFDFDRDHSLSMRFELHKAGWNMVKAHPFTGVGVGMFKPNAKRYNPNATTQIAHNTYLGLAAETGIPSLMMYLAIMVLSWNRARRLGNLLQKQGDMVVYLICRSLETGIVGFAVAATFLSADYIRHYWLLVFMVLAIQRLVWLQEEMAMPVQAAPRLTRDKLSQPTMPNPVSTPTYPGVGWGSKRPALRRRPHQPESISGVPPLGSPSRR